MPNLFGLNIKKIIRDATAGQLVPGTLTSVTPGARGGSVTGGRTQTTATYTFEGIIDDYRDFERDGTAIKDGDRRVLLITGSLSSPVVPLPNWDVTIEGSTYRVVNVARDPAEATYTLQVRKP